jgi:hypothetical protein
VCENIEHVDGIATDIVSLLARLAVDRDSRVAGDIRQAGEPKSEGFAELFQGKLGDASANGGGVGRPFPCESQRTFEASPVILGQRSSGE